MPNPEKSSSLSNSEQLANRTMLVLGPAAIGSIGPKRRIEAGENIKHKEINKLADAIYNGKFHVALEDWQTLPNKCVDGRPRGDGEQELGPNSAGGSLSLVAADMLTHQDFRTYNGEEAQSSAEYAHNVFSYVKDKDRGHELGDHCDDHAEGDASGCGAVDNMQAIFRHMANHPEAIHSMASVLGVEVTGETHDMIIANAGDFAEKSELDFSPGSEIIQQLRQDAGDDSVETLQGAHKEVILSVNTIPGTTFDRNAARESFGEDYQAFNVDVWALKEAASFIANDDEAKAQQKFGALVYYNIATALVLAGKSLQIVSVK